MTWYQANNWCDKLNSLGREGRSNWKLATKNELSSEVFIGLGDGKGDGMKTNYYWPTKHSTWSSTANSVYYFVVQLYDGDMTQTTKTITLLVFLSYFKY
ncbi:DUF1566 domain-containing protein [Aliivibrio salmonicida]|uniref:Lcl domain-containing protein n=1 Tax=Aliivibrio salmonicida TaxID=40269 RepID=UPI003D0E37D1